MPNWCNNTISISGPTDTIKQLWEDANQEGEAGGLLNAMVPMPEALRDTVKGTGEELQEVWVDGCNNWYDWCVKNWGTKWDVSTEGLEFTDNGDGTAEISGWFDSAWAPPVDAYNYFIENNEDCSISAMWHEPGMDFGGEYEDGEIDECDDLHEEYKLPEDEQSPLFQRLDEWFGISGSYEMWDEEENA